MLYHFYLALFTDFSILKFLGILVLLGFVGGIVWIGGAKLFRWALVPAALIEVYLMSPGYACSYGGVFPRAQAMAGMCEGAPYTAYLNQNFGLNLWYVQAMYIGILLFAIWPLISNIIWTQKDEAFKSKFLKEQAEMRTASAERINRVQKIGRM